MTKKKKKKDKIFSWFPLKLLCNCKVWRKKTSVHQVRILHFPVVTQWAHRQQNGLVFYQPLYPLAASAATVRISVTHRPTFQVKQGNRCCPQVIGKGPAALKARVTRRHTQRSISRLWALSREEQTPSWYRESIVPEAVKAFSGFWYIHNLYSPWVPLQCSLLRHLTNPPCPTFPDKVQAAWAPCFCPQPVGAPHSDQSVQAGHRDSSAQKHSWVMALQPPAHDHAGGKESNDWRPPIFSRQDKLS